MSSQIYQEVPGTLPRAARIRYSPPQIDGGRAGPLGLTGLGRESVTRYFMTGHAQGSGNAAL